MASLEDRITKEETNSKDDKTSKSEPQTDGATEIGNGSSLQEPEYDVKVKLSDLQEDPNNPLYSAKSFNDLGLPEALLKGIFAMNFRKPSKIQERALPLLLLNPAKNFIGQSQSGTGKTAAFTLNMLARIDTSTKQPQCLVLAPSRELARQIMGVVDTMGQYMKPGLVVGQAIPDPANRGQQMVGQIIVGTPGTVMDLIRRKQLDPSKLKVLVLDEADNMLDQQGLGDQCSKVKNLVPKDIQTVLFSATFPEKVVTYADRFAPNANQIMLKQEELTVEGIKHIYMDCNSEEHKYEVLVKLYGLMTVGSSIIFVRRRDTAAEIEKRMTAEGHKVASLTGALEGKDRDAVIDRFRNGEAKVLITTNVLARGIDVASVSIVVNYDVPDNERGQADPETYLHRVGRTGRFGRVGVAVTFVYDKKSWQALNEIVTYLQISNMNKVPTDDWDLVEEMVHKIIKSSRAASNFQQLQ